MRRQRNLFGHAHSNFGSCLSGRPMWLRNMYANACDVSTCAHVPAKSKGLFRVSLEVYYSPRLCKSGDFT